MLEESNIDMTNKAAGIINQNATSPKPDYHKELESIIKNNEESGKLPTILLHSCCGPCSSYVLFYLMQHFDITVLFYNPNIFPEEEYEHRLSEQKRLIDVINNEGGLEFEMNDRHFESKLQKKIKLMTVDYDHREFTDFVTGFEREPEGGARCKKCFELRLYKAKEIAEQNGFEYFGTTLTVSPHKNAVLINELGKEIDSIHFLPSDFKKKEGYRISTILSKQLELYRQNFCGCEFARI